VSLGPADADALRRCIAAGGVAVFPADTVYGLACDPQSHAAVVRLYELKGRPADKPAAVMFFALDRALAALPELGSRTRGALARLLPGAVTVLLDNPQGRFPLACGADPATLGLRVPALSGAIEALGFVATAVLQSSANRAGGADARAVGELDPRLRAAADLVLDGGPLPGTPSTIVDLRTFERDGGWRMLREGAIAREQLVGLLGPQAPRSTAHAAVRGS
jgi:L-threonylcarbamoyladenylate synthase